jgi:hypothetical protein
MGLWDRVNDRRKQKKTDGKQNDEITKLRERVEEAEKRANERQLQLRDRPDDLGNNFQMSSAMIQRQYDEGYGRLGRRFAMGDGKCGALCCSNITGRGLSDAGTILTTL